MYSWSLVSRLVANVKYEKYLFRIPIVATLNYSTQNLSLLDTHDWLSKAGNRVVVHFRGFVA